jgi:citrate/tricarballylate utilization protein
MTEAGSHIDEARRVMTVCNACRYCEGLCATFQAMSLKRAFDDTDLDYLANLCHNCTACYHDCQYAEPHAFDINVPRSLAALRVETYGRYAWPGFLARLFEQNGLVVSLITALALSLVLLLAAIRVDPAALFGAHAGPGAFYEVISHGVMVAVAGGSFGFSVLALLMGFRGFMRATGTGVSVTGRAVVRALHDVATMKYLDGGHGEGCNVTEDDFSNERRAYHQLTMWGFLLCFAATCVATVYDYGLGLAAPYPFFSLPVLLGTIGGAGLVVGPAGLFLVKQRADPRPMRPAQYGMDYAFLALLFMVSSTGLLLLVVRETPLMGVTLAVHLGFVLALFLTLPYGKFVHAIYRFAAILRFHSER